MAEPTRLRVEMRDFPGLDVNADPMDIQAGAGREQVNLIPGSGQMRVRRGLALVTFEAETDVT